MKRIIIFLIFAMLLSGCVKQTEKKEISQESKQTTQEKKSDRQAYDIIWSSYDKLLDQSKEFFIQTADGDENKAKEVYNKYFLKFNLLHEASHVIQRESDAIMAIAQKGDMFTLEQKANDMAIAYWKAAEPEFVDEIESIVDHFLSILEDPVPKGEDKASYFNENIEELASDPSKYGYFQFYFVKQAIGLNSSYYEIVSNHIDKSLKEYKGEIEKKKYEIGDVKGIIQGYVNFANLYGIETAPIITIEEASLQIQHMGPSSNPNLEAITPEQ